MLCPINWNGLLCSEIVVCFAGYIRVMTRCTSWIWRNLFDLQQQWESLLSPLCPSTLGSGRHKPFIPRRGSRRVSGLLHTFQRLLRRQKKELSQETWQVIPSLGVLVTHWQKSPTGHSWGWQEINHLLRNRASLLFLQFSICF